MRNQSLWSFETALSCCGILLPVLAACFVLYSTAPGLPYQDDFHAILAFALHVQRVSPLSGKLLLAVSEQFNEYKLMFEHLVIMVELGAVHHVEFVWLNALGNSFLFATGSLLWFVHREYTQVQQRLATFVPVAMICFSLSYWETLNWTMITLQNLAVVFFALLSLFLLVPRQESEVISVGRFSGACFSGLLASISSANGFFVLICGLIYLLRTRSYKRAAAWSIPFVFSLSCYLYNYHKLVEPHRKLVSRVFALLSFPGLMFPFRFAALFVGIAVWAFLFTCLRRRMQNVTDCRVYWVLWLVLTSLVIALVRGYGSSRYSIYSILLLVLCYSFWLQDRQAGKTVYARGLLVWTAASILLLTYSDIRAYRQLSMRQNMIVRGFEKYLRNPAVNSPQVNPEVDATYPEESLYELRVLQEASRTRIYDVPVVR